MNHTGDIFIYSRLAEWTKRGALISDPEEPPHIIRGVRYRLSDVGESIKRSGLKDIIQGAPVPIWGATAYDPAVPWVVVSQGKEEAVTLWGGPS
jgi:hypothetical protein